MDRSNRPIGSKASFVDPPQPKGIVWTFQSLLDPRNLFIVVLNLIAFAVIQTLFFWFIGSKQVDIVVEQKADFFSEFAKRDPIANQEMIDYLNDPKNGKPLADKVKIDNERSTAKNWELTYDTIGPPFFALCSILGVMFLSMVAFHKYPTSIDAFLALMVITAFTTELFFYFLVVRQQIVIGDAELRLGVLKPLLDWMKENGLFTSSVE